MFAIVLKFYIFSHHLKLSCGCICPLLSNPVVTRAFCKIQYCPLLYLLRQCLCPASVHWSLWWHGLFPFELKTFLFNLYGQRFYIRVCLPFNEGHLECRWRFCRLAAHPITNEALPQPDRGRPHSRFVVEESASEHHRRWHVQDERSHHEHHAQGAHRTGTTQNLVRSWVAPWCDNGHHWNTQLDPVIIPEVGCVSFSFCLSIHKSFNLRGKLSQKSCVR